MTQQMVFGGFWTQQKLRLLAAYLRQYRRIFEKNRKGQFFEVSYVDAFAGTGVIPQEEPRFVPLIEIPTQVKEEIAKGSVRRALEIEPPFHHYVFIEKHAQKCAELKQLAEQFPDRDIEIINDDANVALLNWCLKMNTKRERAVVFLDPFGASVDWQTIEAIAATRAIDLWVLFPIGAISRMLNNDKRPTKALARRLTRVFGTERWKIEFYSSRKFYSIINPSEVVEEVQKSADQREIIEFFRDRLASRFVAVSQPGILRNTKGGLLFVLFFAAGNRNGASPGLKIANNLVAKLNQLTL